MDDISTLFAAAVCIVVILIAMWYEYRPSLFKVRQLVGLETVDVNTMDFDEVVNRITKRALNAYYHNRVALSNGVYAEYIPGAPPNVGGTYPAFIRLYLKRQDMRQFPLVVHISTEHPVGHITGIESTAQFGDAYQWMMEQMDKMTCYEIVKRSYVCEQNSLRGDDERLKVRKEYIQWITRKFI